MKTVVLGSGGWGTALSLVLHRNGHPVTLWSHVPEKAAYMERARENPRLEGVPLPPELRLTADMTLLHNIELQIFALKPDVMFKHLNELPDSFYIFIVREHHDR